MEDSVLHYLVDRISNAKIQIEPFPHFYIEQVFPEKFYLELISQLPDLADYQSISKTGRVSLGEYKERFSLRLEDQHLIHLPFSQFLFWKDFSRAFHSPLWLSTLLDKFQPYLKKRFGKQYRKTQFSSVMELYRDFSGYSIGPHTDLPIRAMSLLFYFPKNSDRPQLGTSIYRAKDPSFQCEGHWHHFFADFHKVYTAAFLPNSLFGFVKTSDSFHGVEAIDQQAEARDLMSYCLVGKQE